jgi:hypothetical protein
MGDCYNGDKDGAPSNDVYTDCMLLMEKSRAEQELLADYQVSNLYIPLFVI